MGAWSYVEPRLHNSLRKDKNDRGVRYVTHNTVKLGPKEHAPPLGNHEHTYAGLPCRHVKPLKCDSLT